jgi:hypothetical protein
MSKPDISDHLRSLFTRFHFPNKNELHLNALFPVSLWASIIDFFQRIRGNQKRKFFRFLQAMMNEATTSNDLMLRRITFASAKKTYTLTKLKSIIELCERAQEKDSKVDYQRVKVDFYLVNDAYIDEVSIVYQLSDVKQSDKAIVRALVAEMNTLSQAGQYYRILQYLAQLEEIVGFTPQMKSKLMYLLDNSTFGFMFMTAARLRTLHYARAFLTKQEFMKDRNQLGEDISVKMMPELMKSLKLNRLLTVANSLMRRLHQSVKADVLDLVLSFERREGVNIKGSGFFSFVKNLGKKLVKDLPRTIANFGKSIVGKKELIQMSSEARLFARMVNESYEKYPKRQLDGWELIWNNPRICV